MIGSSNFQYRISNGATNGTAALELGLYVNDFCYISYQETISAILFLLIAAALRLYIVLSNATICSKSIQFSRT